MINIKVRLLGRILEKLQEPCGPDMLVVDGLYRALKPFPSDHVEVPARRMQWGFNQVKKALIRHRRLVEFIALTDSKSGEIQTMHMPPWPPMNRFIF